MTVEIETAPLLPRVGEAARLVAVFGSAFRVQILAAVADAGMTPDGRTSPKAIAETLDAALGTIAYHVRTLAGAGIIEPAGERRVRGAVEHFYRLTPAGHEAVQLVERFVSP